MTSDRLPAPTHHLRAGERLLHGKDTASAVGAGRAEDWVRLDFDVFDGTLNRVAGRRSSVTFPLGGHRFDHREVADWDTAPYWDEEAEGGAGPSWQRPLRASELALCLCHADPRVRAAALDEAGTAAPLPLLLLRCADGDEPVRQRARALFARALAFTDDDMVPPLAALALRVGVRHHGRWGRDAVIDRIGGVPADAVRELRASGGWDDCRDRKAGIRAGAESGALDEDALYEIALTARDPSERLHGLRAALGDRRDHAARRRLLAFLAVGEGPEVRGLALRYAVDTGLLTADDLAGLALGHRDRHVRHHAARVLARWAEEGAPPAPVPPTPPAGGPISADAPVPGAASAAPGGPVPTGAGASVRVPASTWTPAGTGVDASPCVCTGTALDGPSPSTVGAAPDRPVASAAGAGLAPPRSGAAPGGALVPPSGTAVEAAAAAAAAEDVEAAMARLSGASDGVVRGMAVAWLRAGRRGDGLVAWLADPSPWVRGLARDGLREAGGDPRARLRALCADPATLTAPAVSALAQERHPEDVPLLHALARHADGAVRARALGGLRLLGAVEDGELPPYADDPDPRVGAVVLRALRDDPGALRGLLTHRHARVRARALVLLSRRHDIGWDEALPHLADPAPEMVRAAREALGSAARDASTERLIACAAPGEAPALRVLAMEILRGRRSPESLLNALRLLDDPHPGVRAIARDEALRTAWSGRAVRGPHAEEIQVLAEANAERIAAWWAER
ncbi:hypothetical protein [Streptomyces sp. NPDC004435]|uniref:hypothetical protein n=1 Tax=Streptomyces sp. NPDC004435 TaxID=3364701 RepID=UPI00367E2917